MNIIALALLGAVFFGILYRGLGDDAATVEPEPQTDWLLEPCDTTGCPYTGWIPATRRDNGQSVLVCSGDYADGQLRGWWRE